MTLSDQHFLYTSGSVCSSGLESEEKMDIQKYIEAKLAYHNPCHARFINMLSLALCIRETPNQVLLQTVKTQMKCRVMLHFIRVYTVCKDKKDLQTTIFF